MASNSHGKARGHLTLTGTAGVGVFDSPPVSPSKDLYNISWAVSSHAAVTEFRLYFRPQPSQHRTHRQHDDLNMIHRMVSNNKISILLLFKHILIFQDTINTNVTSLMSYRNEWNSVVLPGPGGMNPTNPYAQAVAPPYPGVTRQKMWYLIKGLQPGMHYEARVQAKNMHGWNKLSPVFHFSTRSQGNKEIFNS